MPGMQVKVLEKAVHILELLARSNKGLRLKDVAVSLSLNKTTALRILRVLESHNLATRDGANAFALGTRVFWWGTRYQRRFRLLRLVRPCLEQL